MSNERARKWLESLGFAPEYEPAWIKEGQKPDYFAAGASPLWVEVKTLDPPEERRILDRAYIDLRRRCRKETGLTGDLYVSLGKSYDERAAKWIIGCIRLGDLAPAEANVFTVPIDPDYSGIVQFQYEARDGLVCQTSAASVSGKYPFYPALEPWRWHEKIEVRSRAKPVEHRELYDLLESDDCILAARLFASSQPLSLHGGIGRGFAGNFAVDRIRSQIGESNSQLRNGQKYRRAPGLSVIYHESLDFAGDLQLLAAALGDVEIRLGADGSPRIAAHGRHGAWSPTKNRGVSALRYVRTEESNIIVLNPWADIPIKDWRVFKQSIWLVNEGRVVKMLPDVLSGHRLR